MDLNSGTYHYVGQISLQEKGALEQQQQMGEGHLDPWLFLVMDKKGEERFTFFYTIEDTIPSPDEMVFTIQMSFIMEKALKSIELGRTYDVWKREKFIGVVKIVAYCDVDK